MAESKNVQIAGGPATLKTGVYYVDAPCPRCGAIEEILISIRSVVTIPETDTGKLAVKLRGKPRDHDCRQNRLTQLVDAETGEILGNVDG